MKKLSLFMAFIMMISVVFVGCGRSTDPGTTEPIGSTTETKPVDSTNKTAKEAVTIVHRAGPNGFDPNTGAGGAMSAYMLSYLIFDRLMEKDPETGEFLPSLAESWERIDDTTFQFKLRDDAYFHNGEKLTAADVVYSFVTAATNPAAASSFKMIDPENTKALDETTVELKLNYSFGALFSLLSGPRGSIIPEAYTEEVGADYATVHPVGTGCMKLDELVTGDRVVLSRNEDYWGEKPSYKTFTLRFISEASTRAVEVETGSVDGSLYIEGNTIDALQASPKVQVLSGPSYTYIQLQLNCLYQDQLSDEVRQAMLMAIDTKALTKAVYGEYGAAEVVPSALTCGDLGIEHVYNPEKAKELLAASDWDFEKGVIDFYCTNTVDVAACSEVVANMWTQIGLTVKIHSVDSAGWSALYEGGESTLKNVSASMISNTCTNGDVAFIAANLHGYTYTMNNIEAVGDQADLYQIINESATLYEESERTAMYAELFTELQARGIEMYLASPHNIQACYGDVEGFYVAPNNMPDLSGMTVWE